MNGQIHGQTILQYTDDLLNDLKRLNASWQDRRTLNFP